MPLLQYKTGVRCAKRILDAASWNISTWCVFWNISVMLAIVWLRNVRLKNLWINIFVQLFNKFGWIFCFWFYLVGCYLWYSNSFKNETSVTLEAYSELCQTSKMEVFTKIVNGFSFLTIFAKSSISDLWQNSEFPCKPRRLAEKAPSQIFSRVFNSPLY